MKKLISLLSSNLEWSKRRSNKRRAPSKFASSKWNFSKNVYSLSTKPQRYGPGIKIQNIEYFDVAAADSFVNLDYIISNSAEHQINKTIFNYFKILNIAVVFPMQQTNLSKSYLVFQLNWNNQDTSNIPIEENSKWVPIYRTKDLVYKFVPPDIPLILGTNLNPVVINLNNYMRTTDPIVVPGCLNFQTSSDVTSSNVIYRVIIKVEYRGSKLPDSNKMLDLANKLKSIEQNNRNKERRELVVVETGNALPQSATLQEKHSKPDDIGKMNPFQDSRAQHEYGQNHSGQHEYGQNYSGPRAGSDVFTLRAGGDVFTLSDADLGKHNRQEEVGNRFLSGK